MEDVETLTKWGDKQSPPHFRWWMPGLAGGVAVTRGHKAHPNPPHPTHTLETIMLVCIACLRPVYWITVTTVANRQSNLWSVVLCLALPGAKEAIWPSANIPNRRVTFTVCLAHSPLRLWTSPPGNVLMESTFGRKKERKGSQFNQEFTIKPYTVKSDMISFVFWWTAVSKIKWRIYFPSTE